MNAGSSRDVHALARVLRVTICVAVLVLLADSCTAARTNLGTSDSACYLALPSATKAVHSAGRLIGVQRSTLTKLKRSYPVFVNNLHVNGAMAEQICLFAFSGRFTAQSVSKPRGRPVGRLAVVVLSTPANALLGTAILRHAPLRFGHPHIG
jgi:hypothetical protein